MNHSTPGLPVHHQLLEFTQIHPCPLSRWCHPTISSSVVPFSSCPQSFPVSGSFPVSQLFTSGGQSTGVSAFASFLPKSTRGWSPLEWTGWISLHVNRELPDVQAGFRKGRGTRDQIASIRWIMKKARQFQKKIYFCFIDYAKAFDYVDHNKLWKILREMGIPDDLTCLLRNLMQISKQQ